jgi:trimethylamine--corrinoid protein Co-methyltransferase
LAETLLATVLCHLKNPGMPLIMGGVTTILDMKKSTYSYGAPELSLASAANTDIAKWLNLLMFSTGGCTDAKILDEQAASEQMMNLFYSFLSGANLIHDVGYIDHGTNASLESLVLNDEMMGMVRQFGKGINTDDEHLALDLIEKQAPGGEYVTTDHTFKYWKEWFLPNLQDRSDYETWKSNGKKTMGDRVKERTQHLLDTYNPIPIDPKLKDELHKIIDAADKRHS